MRYVNLFPMYVVCSGIIHDGVLNGGLHVHRFEMLIYLDLFTEVLHQMKHRSKWYVAMF